MATVNFNLINNRCSKPNWETQYSIHLQNYLSQNELSDSMRLFQRKTNCYYPNYTLSVFLVVIFMLLPWSVYFLGMAQLIGTQYYWQYIWILFGGASFLSFVPIFLWVFYIRRNTNLFKAEIQNVCDLLNRQFAGRCIHFRFRTTSLNDQSHQTKNVFSIEIELGHSVLDYQQLQSGFFPTFINQNGQPIFNQNQIGFFPENQPLISAEV